MEPNWTMTKMLQRLMLDWKWFGLSVVVAGFLSIIVSSIQGETYKYSVVVGSVGDRYSKDAMLYLHEDEDESESVAFASADGEMLRLNLMYLFLQSQAAESYGLGGANEGIGDLKRDIKMVKAEQVKSFNVEKLLYVYELRSNRPDLAKAYLQYFRELDDLNYKLVKGYYDHLLEGFLRRGVTDIRDACVQIFLREPALKVNGEMAKKVESRLASQGGDDLKVDWGSQLEIPIVCLVTSSAEDVAQAMLADLDQSAQHLRNVDGNQGFKTVDVFCQNPDCVEVIEKPFIRNFLAFLLLMWMAVSLRAVMRNGRT